MTEREIVIGGRKIGDGHPCYIIAEIGINHDGSIDKAMELMRAAADAGVDAVKFQKRTDMASVIPEGMWDQPKETPWGETIPYHEYRYQMEFNKDEYKRLFRYAGELGVHMFASVWDVKSIEWFMEKLPESTVAFKIPSALLTRTDLLDAAAATQKPLILSTGMSSMEEVRQAAQRLLDVGSVEFALLHCHSAYPAPVEELNLNVIDSWRHTGALGKVPIGYSGHEVGLAPSVAAVALGANIIERHITLDRSSQGSDHAASVEPQGFSRLVRDIRAVEAGLGDSTKMVHGSEQVARRRLRGD